MQGDHRFAQRGQAVAPRLEQEQPLLEVATDKADTEVPAPSGGRVTRILAAEGAVVPVATVLLQLDDSGISICAHGKAPGPRQFRGGTVSSEISETQRRRFWYCYGWPCGSAPEA